MNKTTLASAIILALSISACSDNKTATEYIDLSQTLLAENKVNEAVINLKNAVVENPRNGEIRSLLGQAYLEQAHYIAAEKELEKASQLGYSTNINAMLSLAKLKLGKYKDVFELLSAGSNASDDEYVLLLIYAGIASIQIGELEQGQDYFSQATSINEETVFGQLSQAYLEQTKSNYNQALEIVDNILKTRAHLSEAILLKGNLQYGLGQFQKAASTFEQYVKQKPRALYVKFFQINSLIRANNFENAEIEVDLLLTKLKNSPLADQYKAQIEYQKANYREAKEYAEKAIQGGNDYFMARAIAGLSAYQLQDIEQAYFHLRPLESSVDNNHPVKRILAVIKLELGYLDDAVTTLTGITDDNSDFLQVAGQELLLKGELPSALAVLEKAEELSPRNAKIKVQKAGLMLAAGDDASASLEQALQLDPNLHEVETALALSYLSKNEDEKAKAIADKRKLSDDQKINGLLLEGVYLTKQLNHEGAKVNFEQVLLLEPLNIAALYNLAVYAENEGNHSKSAELYGQVIQQIPSHKKALSGFVQSHMATSTLPVAITQLEGLNAQLANHGNLTLALGTAYRLNQQTDKALALLEQQIKSNQGTQSAHYILLGDIYLTNGDFKRSRATYESGLAKYKDDYFLMLREVGALEANKDYTIASQKIDYALTLFKNDTRLKVLQAHMSYLSGKSDLAKGYLEELNSNHISHQLTDVLNGHFAFQSRNFQKATDYYYKAFNSAPNQRNTLFLARSLNSQSKAKEATVLMEKYLSGKQDYKVQILLAELYSGFERKSAIKHYTALVKALPANGVLLNNLAWQLYLEKDYKSAFKYSEQAKFVMPENQSVLDTYNKIALEFNTK